jgi:RNA polymerase sigma factor (sigma-70 family)
MMAARLVEIEEVYRSRYGAFLRVATAVVGHEQLARDAVHDGFVRAVRHRRRFRGEAPLEAWLWRIVINEARKQRTREAREPVPGAAAEPGWDNGAAEQLRALIAALPERQRLVLFLRYYADLDYSSIAESLGIASGTVGATLTAARSTLRRKLQEVQI